VRALSNLLTALGFFACAAAAGAQSSALYPLDHFWTRALDAPFAAPPAADERFVYLALRTGRLSAVDPVSGTEAWSVELDASAPPLAADGRVYLAASGTVQALSGATGAVLWRLPADRLSAPLAHRAGWLIVSLADGSIQGVRAADGVVVWARQAGAPVASAPSIDGDLLAAGLADGRVVVMDLATGNPRWERPLGAVSPGVTLAGDRVFAGTDDGYFWSLKTRNGSLDWRWHLGARVIGAPSADDDRVFLVAVDNVVRGLSRGSGNQRWNYPLITRALSGPVLVDGLVVITTGEVGHPGLTYIRPDKGEAGGRTPPLPAVNETMRVQFPVIFTAGASPRAFLATATTGGDWALHGYRQTFLAATPGVVIVGKLYEIRLRLDVGRGVIPFGTRVTIFTLPETPKVP